MAAVVFDRQRKNSIRDILIDIKDSDNYYFAAIGRSQDWNDSDVAPVPQNSLNDAREARLGIQSIKNITDQTFVIPRYNWTSGAVYSAYNDDQQGYPTNAYYVMNSNQQIYICLQQGKTEANPPQVKASTVQPTGNTTGAPFRTADGYMWKFLYSIGALKASKFISTAYIPVQKVQDSDNATLLLDEVGVDSDSPAEDVEQQLVQQAAVSGQILGYEVVKGGSGYTSVPTLTIVGDGNGAKAVPTVTGGAIVKVEVGDSGSVIALGSGYSRASIKITGGGGDSAEIRPIIGPTNGLGADPRDELKSGAIMFNAKPTGDEDGTFVVNQDFRQVMLVKNPLVWDYDSANDKFTAESGKALRKLVLTSENDGPFVDDLIVEGGTSGTRAAIVDVDSTGIFYYQSNYTGYGEFTVGETISIVEGGGATTAVVGSKLNGEFDPLTGELLYIDNRAAVIRSTDQTEDIKIVIQL